MSWSHLIDRCESLEKENERLKQQIEDGYAKSNQAISDLDAEYRRNPWQLLPPKTHLDAEENNIG